MRVNLIIAPILLLALNVSAKNMSTKIIYGEDNRVDMSDVFDPTILYISKAVAGRVHRWSYDYLDEEQKGNIFFFEPPTLSDPWGSNVCSDEKFADQPTIADCTGFLIGEDILVTAGHCLVYPEEEVRNKKTEQCQDFQWLFDFEAKDSNQINLDDVDRSKLYNCKKVIYAKLDDDNDFGIIQLDRKVKDREFLKIRRSGKVKKDDPLYVIGHPSGLPKKFAPGAKVIGNSKEKYFSTNLDTFGGNSGSPVINAKTHEVEGILVRGKIDYIESPNEDCMRVNVCDAQGNKCRENDEEIDGEQVTRISEIIKFI